MWFGLLTGARLLLGGWLKALWEFVSKIPWQVVVGIVASLLLYLAYSHQIHAAHDAGVAEANKKSDVEIGKLKAELFDAWTAAADAEGRDQAHATGLSQCIGARVTMDLLTSSVLAQREQERATTARALSRTRQELANAYASTADRCAAQPVPDAVVRVLDAAAFGPPDQNADGAGGGAEVRSRVAPVDGADSDTSTAGTTYQDLAVRVAVFCAFALLLAGSSIAATVVVVERGPHGSIKRTGRLVHFGFVGSGSPITYSMRVEWEPDRDSVFSSGFE